MTRKEKITLRQHQSTRQLMGIQRITPHGVTTAQGEMIFFLVRPDNLTVQSEEGVRSRVTALANLLRAEPAIELLVLDARESFQSNRAFLSGTTGGGDRPRTPEASAAGHAAPG